MSLFLWILPLLSFAIATTIFGTLIGGTFGWISAVAVGLVKAPAESSDSRGITLAAQSPGAVAITKPKTRASIEVTEPRKSETMPAAGAMLSSNARLSQGPEMWTRRRRFKHNYAAAPAAPTYNR
ncbi:hypothetical protein GGF44_006536 [Coemansia sp. RSA 1694]|nr:hypothetical protein GGF38_002496 [Coemansia sp. RSA 25]KAJ2474953.1 hypothetical protein IWW47_006598 [Coemansia sp. RSA 2052]KAJ2607004.1 hypothetical protein GGF44_006536 [Coemansia sp. RSA 1694]